MPPMTLTLRLRLDEEALEDVAAVAAIIILEWLATFAALITDITEVSAAQVV